MKGGFHGDVQSSDCTGRKSNHVRLVRTRTTLCAYVVREREIIKWIDRQVYTRVVVRS